MTQTRSRQSRNAPHASATATALPTQVGRSIVQRMVMSCDVIRWRGALPKLAQAELLRTARRHVEHTQSVRQASNQCRPRPQPRPPVPRQHSGSNGHTSFEPVGLGRPPPPPAALQRRPAGSPCHPRPRGSFSIRSMTCGRRGPSLVNAWWRRVVSGPCYFTHLDCRGADRDVESSSADCLLDFIGRSIKQLHGQRCVACDARGPP